MASQQPCLYRYSYAVIALLLWLPSVLGAQILERGNGPEPDSLDPQRAQSLSAQNILRDVFEGLTREDQFGNVIAGIATRWETSADGKLWAFHLRPDAKFSDGSAITSKSFVESFARALDPATAAPYATQLSVIEGALARLQGKASAELGVKAVTPLLLTLQLSQVTPNLPARLSLPVAAAVPTQVIARFGNQWTRAGNVVSSGAYTVREWRPLASILLQKNPHYYEAAQVALEQVRYHVTEDASEEARRFEAGELQITETIPPGRLAQLRARFGAKLRIAPSLGTFFLGFNLTQPPLKGKLPLRQALSLAVDRTRIVEIITGTGELPAYGLLPPALGQTVTARASRLENEQKARALYESAGYSATKPLTIELRYNTSLLNRRLMLAISVMWEQVLGVQTVLRQEEMKVLVQNRKARRITQAYRGGWNADLADPLDFLDTFAADSALNTTGFQSERYSTLLAQLHQTSEPVQAKQLALAAEAELMAAQPILPLFFYTSKHLVSDQIAGFEENPLDHHPSRLLRWRASEQAR